MTVVDATSVIDADAADGALSDAELEELALAGELDAPLAADAVPLSLLSNSTAACLPSWYMPPVGMHRFSRWRTVVVVSIVATLVALEALGLCSVFGQVVIG